MVERLYSISAPANRRTKMERIGEVYWNTILRIETMTAVTVRERLISFFMLLLYTRVRQGVNPESPTNRRRMNCIDLRNESRPPKRPAMLSWFFGYWAFAMRISVSMRSKRKRRNWSSR